MKQLGALTLRNMRLYFKDKGLFFVSLITPAVLLVLFVTFLGNIYKKSFLSALPPGLLSGESLVDATVGGQLISSLLAVSCVTVAFCSNILMVQDRANGTISDLTVTPVSYTHLDVYKRQEMSIVMRDFRCGGTYKANAYMRRQAEKHH